MKPQEEKELATLSEAEEQVHRSKRAEHQVEGAWLAVATP